MSIPDAQPKIKEALSAGDVVVATALRFYRRALIAAALAIAIMVGTVIYGDSTLNTINQRGRQNQVILMCVVRSQNGIIRDVPLAFSGDKNANDYAKEHRCSVPK